MADRNFERALRSAARRGRAAGVCPDAATLAAYADRGLSTEEHRAIEAHVADCMTCTEHLALVAALDAPEESSVPVPAVDFGRLIRKWGWLVPAMTAVLVVAVWLRSSDERSVVVPPPAAPRAAEPALEPPRDASSADREAPPAGTDSLQAKRDAAVRDASTKAGTPSRRADTASTMAAAAKPAAPPLSEAEERTQERLAQRNVAVEKDKEEAKKQEFAAARAPAAKAAPLSATADTRETTLAKASPAPMTDAALGARMRAVARQESATGSVLVRTTSGRIDRSTDGGVSWISEHGDVTDRIQVTLCPTVTACWLGAENGAVYVRNANGQWTRRIVPAPAATVQRIVAVDNQHATVELSDGRRYVTTDGGATWTIPATQR